MNSGQSNAIKVVGYFDCYGGGQVVVRERIAYVGHIAPPHGTSIIDVTDPYPNLAGGEQKRVITSITADELKYTNPATSTGTKAEAVWRRAK